VKDNFASTKTGTGTTHDGRDLSEIKTLLALFFFASQKLQI